jgi:hypothetical protein
VGVKLSRQVDHGFGAATDANSWSDIDEPSRYRGFAAGAVAMAETSRSGSLFSASQIVIVLCAI